MAIDVVNDRPVPKYTTVAAYTVNRLGSTPNVTIEYAETLPALQSEAEVDAVASNTMTVSSWIGAGWVLGSTVYTADGDLVGQPTDFDDVTGLVTFTDPVDAGLVGVTVGVLRTHALGQGVFHKPVSGRKWQLQLAPTSPEAVTAMQLMMFNIHVALVTEALAALSVDKTALEVQAAVAGLANMGRTVDTVIAEECEALEESRRAGTAPSLRITGEAPNV